MVCEPRSTMEGLQSGIEKMRLDFQLNVEECVVSVFNERIIEKIDSKSLVLKLVLFIWILFEEDTAFMNLLGYTQVAFA
jgi:hypothetical protein